MFKQMMSDLAAIPVRNPRKPDDVVAVHSPGPNGGIDLTLADGTTAYAAVQADNGTIVCPICQRVHTHGVDDARLSWRTPHCNANVADRSDYAVLRPERRGLLQHPVNWWRKGKTTPMMQPGKSPGLLGRAQNGEDK